MSRVNHPKIGNFRLFHPRVDKSLSGTVPKLYILILCSIQRSQSPIRDIKRRNQNDGGHKESDKREINNIAEENDQLSITTKHKKRTSARLEKHKK